MLRPRAFGLVLLMAALGEGAAELHAAQVEDAVVVLPPLVIEGEIPEPPWRYGVTTRYEILSSCAPSTTRDLVRAITRATEALEVLLPARFLPASSGSGGTTDVLILLDDAHWPARSRESVAALLRAPRPLGAVSAPVPPPGGTEPAKLPPAGEDGRIQTLDRGGPLVWAKRHITAAPEFYRHLRLMDDDVAVTFVLVSADELDPRGWRLSAASVRESLERRVPQLPPWFVSGFLAVYSQLRFEDGRWTLPPATWISPADTRALKSNPALAPDVLPLAEFLQPDPGGAGATASRVRHAQAELLVRWALAANSEEGAGDAF